MPVSCFPCFKIFSSESKLIEKQNSASLNNSRGCSHLFTSYCPFCQLLYSWVAFCILKCSGLFISSWEAAGWTLSMSHHLSQSGSSGRRDHHTQLCPILHLRSHVTEHYQFWQLPRATGVWVLPSFTHPAPPKTHTSEIQQAHEHTLTHTLTSSLLSVS